MPEVGRGRVLGFGTYDARRHPRVRVLLTGLAEHGFDVVEANVPLGLSTADRVAMLRQPWRVPGLVVRLARDWSRLVRRSTAVRSAGPLAAVLVGYMGHFDVLLARVLFPRTCLVLDHLIFAGDTARDRGVRRGWRTAVLTGLDHLAIRCADVVVVDTAEHAALVPARHRGRVVVVPVGADGSWADAGRRAAAERSAAGSTGAARPATPGQLSVVFFGLMTPLQGAPVVAEALRLLGGAVRATVVGDGQDSPLVDAALAGVPGVTRLPWLSPVELAETVADHDVCLGIFGTGAKAARVVPNKVFQGVAAGCVVVTSDTAPQRRLLGDAAVLVPPGDPVALGEVLGALAADAVRLADLRAASGRLRERITPRAVTEPLAIALASR